MTDSSIDFMDMYRHIVATDPDRYEALDCQTDSNWLVSQDGDYRCFFADGAYHCLLDSPNSYRVSVMPNSHLTNFAVQIEMSILAGNGGGLTFLAREDGYACLSQSRVLGLIGATRWTCRIFMDASAN